MLRLLVLCSHESNHVLFAAVERLREYFEVAIANFAHEGAAEQVKLADVLIVRDVFCGPVSKFAMQAPRKPACLTMFVLRGLNFPSLEELNFYDYMICQTNWDIKFLGIPAEKAVLAYGVDSRVVCAQEDKFEDTIMQYVEKPSIMQMSGATYSIPYLPLGTFYQVLVKLSILSVPTDPLGGNGINIVLQARAVGVSKFQVHPKNMRLNEICNAPMQTEVNYAKILFSKISHLVQVKRRMALLYEAHNEDKFYDGFWRAVDLLPYDITRINIIKTPQPILENYDIVLLKTGFISDMAVYVEKYYKSYRKPQLLAICISSIHPPSGEQLALFDVMFYETEWSKNFGNLYGYNTYHAFGYDAVNYVPCSTKVEKDIDWLMVGAIVDWKRPMLLADKEGRRVAIGDADHKKFDRQLAARGVEVIPFVNPDDLPSYFYRAKKVFIGSTFYGGGERCVLDCRAMGIDMEIMPDNPKLKELMESPLWDHKYYARQLVRGIEETIFNRN